jgi:hypothetical protein
MARCEMMREAWETKKQMIRKRLDELLLECEQKGIEKMHIEIEIDALSDFPRVHYEADQKLVNDDLTVELLKKHMGIKS